MYTMARFIPRYAITFGEVAILHVGGAQFGAARAGGGFTVDELRAIADEHPDETEFVMVSDALPADRRASNEAAVLVFRGGAELMGVEPDALLREQSQVAYDRMYWDSRRGATLNKRARRNVVFGDVGQAHSDDYRDPTVQAFAGVPALAEIRDRLEEVLGPKAAALSAEGNEYFAQSSGIGFHGDAERRVVICLSLGGGSTLRYQWRDPGSSAHSHPPVDIAVGHGDVYIASEKATGYDWRSRSKARVVHAAGSAKYIGR